MATDSTNLTLVGKVDSGPSRDGLMEGLFFRPDRMPRFHGSEPRIWVIGKVVVVARASRRRNHLIVVLDNCWREDPTTRFIVLWNWVRCVGVVYKASENIELSEVLALVQ